MSFDTKGEPAPAPGHQDGSQLMLQDEQKPKDLEELKKEAEKAAVKPVLCYIRDRYFHHKLLSMSRLARVGALLLILSCCFISFCVVPELPESLLATITLILVCLVASYGAYLEPGSKRWSEDGMMESRKTYLDAAVVSVCVWVVAFLIGYIVWAATSGFAPYADERCDPVANNDFVLSYGSNCTADTNSCVSTCKSSVELHLNIEAVGLVLVILAIVTKFAMVLYNLSAELEKYIVAKEIRAIRTLQSLVRGKNVRDPPESEGDDEKGIDADVDGGVREGGADANADADAQSAQAAATTVAVEEQVSQSGVPEDDSLEALLQRALKIAKEKNQDPLTEWRQIHLDY